MSTMDNKGFAKENSTPPMYLFIRVSLHPIKFASMVYYIQQDVDLFYSDAVSANNSGMRYLYGQYSSHCCRSKGRMAEYTGNEILMIVGSPPLSLLTLHMLKATIVTKT